MNWKPSSLIVCDDVRVETNGKQILIGVYSGDIVFPSLPARIQQLIFRVSVLRYTADNKSFHFKVTSDNGRSIMDVEGNAPPKEQSRNAVLLFALHQPTFQEAEKYVVEFGFDGELATIGEFYVRAPENTEEIDKVKSANTA